MALAAEAGIRAAGTRLVEVDHRSLLLVERFDRIDLLEGGEQLFRRMAFDYTVGNNDDHRQNHGFLYENGEWRLAEAFDIVAIGGRDHAIGVGRDGRTRSRANLRSGAGDFGLKPAEASNILDPCIEVARRMLRELDRVGLPIEQRNRILECRCEAA